MRSLTPAAILLALLLVPFLLLDLGFCISLSNEWTAGVLLVGLGLGALATRGIARRRRVTLLLVFAFSVVGIREIEWNSRKPFLRDLYSLRPGMTVAEVEAVMRHYIRGTGWPPNPLSQGGGPILEPQGGVIGTTANGDGGQLQLEDRVVFRHTNEGWADSDWGVVRFSEGRVLDVSFFPD